MISFTSERAAMSETLKHETHYCYHCGSHHPKEAMRLIATRTGKRWRCIKSIEATRTGQAEREAFGRQSTAMNKSYRETITSRMTNPERTQHY